MQRRIPGSRYILMLTMALVVLNLSRAEIHLPHLFGDHMVLQRDRPVTIWGWAKPGEKIEMTTPVDFRKFQADEEGKWSCTLDPMAAGGPFEWTLKGENKIVLKDVMIGDVWVASGQSNMQWMVRQTPYVEQDTAWIRNSPVRLFTVQIASDYLPREDVEGGSWRRLSTENIADFSAVAYHFARVLQQDRQIPLGIINSSLGATSIETWMSNESLVHFDQFRPELEPIIRQNKSFAELKADFAAGKEAWQKKLYLTGPGIEGNWYLPETDISSWQDIQVPGFWEDQGWKDHDGAVWYRKEFDLPEGAEAVDSLLLQLSQIDDYDITWVNGIQVGETYGRHNHRNYWISTDLLKPHRNVLVVRAFDKGGKGGFSTNAFWMSELVRGQWKMRPGLSINASTFEELPSVNVTPFSSPGVLYNANIAPFTHLAVKGIIWYQGESNADRAEEYQTLFRTMILDWRQQWKDAGLPFIYVQLANYRQENDVPTPSDWAELREAQAMALKLPQTGMAVTIDIGEAEDIHPRNKSEVGRRLALAAINVAYGQPVIWHGPRQQEVIFSDSEAMVSFDSSGGQPVTRDKYGYVRGFQIAGSDREFHWAKAEIKGKEIRVWSDQVKKPVAIRYAWSDNPGPLDLYNEHGLPALPFRSDQWPGITKDKRFDPQAARF